MDLGKIQAIIDSENARSQKLVLRLGFKKERVLPQNSVFEGQSRDEVRYSLIKEECKAELLKVGKRKLSVNNSHKPKKGFIKRTMVGPPGFEPGTNRL